MGFRDYSPGLNRFLTLDSYNGALADLSLSTSPWTSNRYGLAGGNPITGIELDGHMNTIGDWGGGGGTVTESPEPATVEDAGGTDGSSPETELKCGIAFVGCMEVEADAPELGEHPVDKAFLELTGINDAGQCFGEGDGSSCAWTGASVIPGAKLVGWLGKGLANAGEWGHDTYRAWRASRAAAKAGPGTWGPATESMSARAAAYQAQITGRAGGDAYRVGGVKFDGFANGALQEAKGPGYAIGVKNGQFQPWYQGADDLAAQAQRQLAVAGGTPITWSVAEAEVVTAINHLFTSRGISGINVMHVPAG